MSNQHEECGHCGHACRATKWVESGEVPCRAAIARMPVAAAHQCRRNGESSRQPPVRRRHSIRGGHAEACFPGGRKGRPTALPAPLWGNCALGPPDRPVRRAICMAKCRYRLAWSPGPLSPGCSRFHRRRRSMKSQVAINATVSRNYIQVPLDSKIADRPNERSARRCRIAHSLRVLEAGTTQPENANVHPSRIGPERESGAFVDPSHQGAA
ncbi:MAG: hypothetical protein JWN85_5035 [Gammaproteobacteria bacterium]|nr:hypothetical protein [Gammaproteobacteria bacterium]